MDRPVPGDSAWWTLVDEEYWQALLEQGEIAPDMAAPAGGRDPFYPLELLLEGAADTLPNGPSGPQPDLPEGGDEWEAAQRAVDAGDRFSLRVSGVNRGGLLVDWNGHQGFVPTSHLLQMPRRQDHRDRIADLSRRIGEWITVRLIEVDARQNRLVFSERAALPGSKAPGAVLDALQAGDVCRGVVTNLTSFGAFVDLGGVEGLIHVSEISWDRVRHPADVLTPGMEVEAHVLEVNADERRIALSLKRLRSNPWATVETRYRPGQVLEGTVTNVVGFGAFVRIEEGVEGLIHISELADGSFLHPHNVVHEGDKVRVRVLNVDAGNRRMGLSLRQTADGATLR